MKSVKSSQVKAVGFDPATKTMAVEFHGGGIYHYSGVTPEQHTKMLASKSIGGHLHAHIKSTCKCVKQAPPKK